ncbi:double-CXXCG motif protein [Pyxidicoccus trucidator]|uniref:SitI6 family double-CXXCG motif immunity protein n=1 Tax=Pyxidicoccus trucidator TaxID=2709662 RepID=UPI0013DD4B2A|nr:double-CXXCG motif protein [Pyxidicoccus trucidator]
MRYYKLSEPHYLVPRTWTGTCRVQRRWGLPGIADCPGCGATWSGFTSYPAIDVSGLSERRALEVLRPEPLAEYKRLAELVSTICPPGTLVQPGTMFGPLHGTARGRFGPLTLEFLWGLLVREDALRTFQAERLRDIVPVSPVFKKPPTPALFELHLHSRGRLHPDCYLPDPAPPCALCGREDVRVHPAPWVDAASLPTDLDVFRLEDNSMYILASERFVEVAQGCGVSDVVFTEVATAPPVKAPRG